MPDELVALSTKKPFNELAGRAASKGSEMLSLIWKAGELAKKAKASLPHGEWMAFVEKHYDVSHDTVARWIKFHEGYAESKLRNVRNLSDGLRMLAPPKSTTPKAAPKPTPPPAGDPFDEVAPDAPDDDSGPSEPEGDSESPPEPQGRTRATGGSQKGNGTPPKQYDRSYWFRQWEQGIGPICRLVDKIAENIGERGDPHQEAAQERLEEATEEIAQWLEVKR